MMQCVTQCWLGCRIPAYAFQCDPKNPQSSCRITVNDHTKNVGVSGNDRGYAFTRNDSTKTVIIVSTSKNGN